MYLHPWGGGVTKKSRKREHEQEKKVKRNIYPKIRIRVK
jgi:hypothetical protein